MKTSNQSSIIILLNSFIRNMQVLIMCPDVISYLVFILSTLARDVINRLLFPISSYFILLSPNRQRVLDCISAPLVSTVRIPSNWFPGWLWPTPVLSLSGVQKLIRLSLCRRELTLKGCRQPIYVFWQNNRQLIPGNRLKLQLAWVVALVHDLK